MCVGVLSFDLMFINDESGSVGWDNYELTKLYMEAAVQQFR